MASVLTALVTASDRDAITQSASADEGTIMRAAVVLAQASSTRDENNPAVLIQSLLVGARDVRAMRLREPRVVMQREPRPAEFGDLDGGNSVSQSDRSALAELFARLKPNTSLQSANPFVADYAFAFVLADADSMAYLLISTSTKSARLVGRTFPSAVELPLNLDPVFPQLKDALALIVEQGRGR